MKKLILAAALCVAALAVAPISSAGAYTGTCKIAGKATFTGGTKLSVLPKPVKYEFESKNIKIGGPFPAPEESVAAVECTGTPEAEKPTEIKVTGGQVDANCVSAVLPGEPVAVALANEIDGAGEVNKEATRKFDLDIASSVLGIVHTKAEKAGSAGETGEDVIKAGGLAEFFTSQTEPASQCFSVAGVSELQFIATISGTI